MSENNLVVADIRDSFGKGAARRLRASGQIPAVIYGHGTEPRHLALPGHQLLLITRRANAVIELSIDGTTELALIKDVQRDPVRQVIEHIDLVVIKKGERVQVEVPVHTDGESFPGTVATLEVGAVNLEVGVTSIPQNVVVSVEGRNEGEHVYAKDIVLPEGATLLDDAELLVVQIAVPAPEETDEETADEAEAETESE
ncbi:50S ribosomal protein L25/general stress protein Ctc [Mycetocola reblochoni]|uniref:Large ribosomal subunit protein bL25 n=2 Tax=Mycetocola reblochoni TaxID=331618 RepID=A0A1R4I6J2_9MICO|nr:50S ribosomal protein L25/general stress protein Ctc [Mycetocola reblochoni]RLP68215.1 50S ribosomal protein L25/general stress protein Ctc [Mycetocola reblochoni]SJN15440.1 LSU ribosomal protein L25p [Mycetocola reblochoni REB411]